MSNSEERRGAQNPAEGGDRHGSQDDEQYRALFENSPVGMWEEDFSRIKKFIDELRAGGVEDLESYLREHPELVARCVEMIDVLDVNQRAREFYGAHAKEELLNQLPGIFDKQAYDVFRNEIVAFVSGQKIFDSEIPAITLNGERRLVDMRVSRVPDPDDSWSRVIVSFADITERKRLEEHFRQTQQLEGIGRLAGGVAHAFNNLLTVIGGYSELLLEEAGEFSPFRDGLIEIRNAAERARVLTQQLLAFGRKQFLQPEVLDLNALVGATLADIRRASGDQVEVIPLLDPSLDKVLADPVQFEQVLNILAGNAAEAMQKKGRLVIETANVELDESYADRYPGVQPGPYVRLAITDTGPGLDEHTKARLFEPFFTTRGLANATGLGLSTVFGTVKQSGGHIWVYSEPGRGTTFKTYLPRAVEPAPAPTGANAVTGELRGAETVLVAEDQADVRRLVCQTLMGFGYRVLEASGGSEALQMAHCHSGPIELLIADVVMPGMTGRDLAERVQAARPDMKVLFMSGYTENAIILEGVLTSGVAFLQKPASPLELARKVRGLLGPAPPSSTGAFSS